MSSRLRLTVFALCSGGVGARGFVVQPHARCACGARIGASEHALSPSAFNMRASAPRLARRATGTAFRPSPIVMLAADGDVDSASARQNARPTSTTSGAASSGMIVSDGSALLRELVDLLESAIGDVSPAILQAAKQIASQLDTVLMRQELMLAANEKVLAAQQETLESALAAQQEALVAIEKVLADKQETLELALAAIEKVLAAQEKAHAATERVSSRLVNAKTAELASFKAQFELRIMIDILYDAIMSSNAFADDLKKGKKWAETLLDGVITTDAKSNSILTPAAMRDLADLNATMELATVVRDLDAKSISNCLVRHNGPSNLTGTGWRLGVQASPSLAVALILIANLRKLDERNIRPPLNGRVAFLNLHSAAAAGGWRRARDVSHELDFGSLRWVPKAQFLS